MRLVCPNCEAKYEVPEDAIPETGRDVQCANCGHAWYQMRPRAAVAEPAPATSAAVAPPAPEPIAEPAPEPEPDAIPEVALTSAAPEPDALPAEAPVEPEPEAAVEPEPPASPAPAAELPVEVTRTDAPMAEMEAVAEAVPEPAPEEAEAPVEAVAAEVEPEPEVAPEAPATGEGVSDAKDDAVDAEPLAAAAAPAAYAVDESVLAILREEAEREAQARKAEAARPLEVQPDLGIDAAMPAARVAAAASAAVGAAAGTLQESEEDAAERAAGRRTRLPDVEEINSTLRPSEVPVEDEPEPAEIVEAEGRSSFRSGFLLVLTIAILASAIYISADALARAVPALAGVLESYVSFINSLRLQMDGLMQSATVAINGTGG